MKRKKLYKVSRELGGYDEYDSAIVCAYSPTQALSEKTAMWQKISYIGVAKQNLPIGLVIGSFNAG